MRSLAEHLQLVISRVRPLEPLSLPLLDARGCVLAADVTAGADVPAFHSSAVMGYAARAGDIAMASPSSVLALRELPTGSPMAPGCVIAVSVGSPLPYGADCVVPVEYTDRGAPVVRVGRPVARGANVLWAGSQIKQGTTLMRVGQTLRSREIAMLAAIGIGKVPAYPRPRIAVLTTGSELVDTSRLRPQPQGSPAVKPDINGVALACAVVEAGALSYRVGPVPDDPVRLRKILDDQLGRADMVVTTGGIGAEADDVLRPVLATMGTVDFAWVALEPGRVQGTGSLGASNVPLIALPGDPVAAFVGFELFVRPVVRRLMGHSDVYGTRRQVRLTEPVEGAAGVTTMVPVVVEDEAATPVPPGVPGLAQATALAVVPPERLSLQRGDMVTAVFLEHA
ncbi:MAG: molybdopterin molybdotransferase MoeA [Candidatus Nanopelagicales bacterium]|nr:molybdopterin molybdotransferase MoeA [Candidatus Nanopelagicales bacterium]